MEIKEKKFFTVKEVAEILNIKEQTLRNYITEGKIESKIIYNSTVISNKEVKRQLELRKENARNE